MKLATIFTESDLKELCDLTTKLIQKKTISPKEDGVLTIIQEELTALGLKIERHDFNDVANIYACTSSGSSLTPNFSKSLNPARQLSQLAFLFAGHLDVVPAGDENQWSQPPFAGVCADNFIWGRGAVDMKSSVAAFITATKKFLKNYPQFKTEDLGSISYLITLDEESVAIDGTVKVVEVLKNRNLSFDYCLVGEPTSQTTLGDTIKVGRRGSLSTKITLRGIQGHIAYPHLADNPIHSLSKLIDNLVEFDWDKGATNKFFAKTSFQVSNIVAGDGATNVIPQVATAWCNWRYNTSTTAAAIKQDFNTIVESLGTKNGHKNIDAQWNHSGVAFLAQNNGNSAADDNTGNHLNKQETNFLHLTQEIINSALGITAEASTGGGTSDARFLIDISKNLIEFGPVGETMHKIDEKIALDDLYNLAGIYYLILEKIFIK